MTNRRARAAARLTLTHRWQALPAGLPLAEVRAVCYWTAPLFRSERHNNIDTFSGTLTPIRVASHLVQKWGMR